MGINIAALMWKNLLLKRNTFILSIVEILLAPLIVFLLNMFYPLEHFHVPSTFNFTYNPNTGPTGDDKLLYVPADTNITDLMKKFAGSAGYKTSNVQIGFLNASNIDDYKYIMQFSEPSSSSDKLAYTLYPRHFSRSDSFEPILNSMGTRILNVELLMYLQFNLDASFISLHSGDINFGVNFTMMKYLENALYFVFVVMTFWFMTVLFTSRLIGSIVDEKGSGAKELMLMMGVKKWELWTSKLLESLIIIGITLSLILIFLYVPIYEESAVLTLVNPANYAFITLFGVVPICIMIFFLSCLFENQTVASLFVNFTSLVALILLISSTRPTRWHSLIYSVHPLYAFLSGIIILNRFESLGKSVDWFERLSDQDGFLTLVEVFIVMVVDIFIFSVLTWYVENIHPGQYGVPSSWGFFLTKSYWFPNKVTSGTESLKSPNSLGGVKVRNLRKEFHGKGRKIVAVDDVSLEAIPGEITALLGHNGAGKSTTMSIITGLIPATSGIVELDGYDTRVNLTEARRSLGLCPQKDFHFRGLTSLQILSFYGMVKGLGVKESLSESRHLLGILKMSDVADRMSENLSGGQKRKLSLAVAIIGSSRILILDEPTSGVDPELRREICDILISFRGERTIIITTHIMEEADAVSDQIVIMDQGKVKCAGTPMDLKKKFGTGYTLSVVVPSEEGRGEEVLNVVKKHVSGSRFKARNATTLTFQLPDAKTNTFPALFDELDRLKSQERIVSFGVSISTLDDVFIRVNEVERESAESENLDDIDGAPFTGRSRTALHSMAHTGFTLLFMQFSAFITKKGVQFIRSLREYLSFIVAIILLTFFIEILNQLGKTLESGHTNMQYFNGSEPLYPDMDIFVQTERNCSACVQRAKIFTEIASNRGFIVTKFDNIEDEVNKLYYSNFHQYAKYLLAAVNFTNKGADIIYNSAIRSIPILNLIDSAYAGFSIQTSANLSFVETDYQYNDFFIESPPQRIPEWAFILTFYFMSNILVEIVNGAKELQLLAAPVVLYWLSHLIFDFVVFFPFTLLMVVLKGWAEGDKFENFGISVAALILWSFGAIQVSYIITCLIKSKTNAFSLALCYVIFGYIIKTLVTAQQAPHWVALFHPTAIWEVGTANQISSDTFLWELAGFSVVIFTLLVLIDTKILGRIFHAMLSKLVPINYAPIKPPGDDVKNEERRVNVLMKGDNSITESLVVSGLRRWFGVFGVFKRKAAVRGISFRVQPSECFGLLGVNGAGKSTAFNMLTGRIPMSGGDAVINSHFLNSYSQEPYLREIGYCPQTTAIIPQLTGRELMYFFAKLRGLREPLATESIQKLLVTLDLQGCQGQPCGKYSGGMERKLNTAVAFLWDSSIVMLDEPTSGVDPVARRYIWEAITEGQKTGKAVVLTSHSMEECEVLCSKLAIMVKGSFRCIGETVTLKNMFGAGYSVLIKLGIAPPNQIENLKKAVLDSFKNHCTLIKHHNNIMHFRVSEAISWGKLFGNLDTLRNRFPCFESYTASETTLEEIFLNFAAEKDNMLSNLEPTEVISIT